MNQEEIAEKLVLHKKWLEDGETGKRADFFEAGLYKSSFKSVDLRRADLRRTDLRYADLRNATLLDANLDGADLDGADFRSAIGSYFIIKRWEAKKSLSIRTQKEIEK